MFTPSRFRLLVIAVPILLVASLSAQRYQAQDHHVFHRPAPQPVNQVKHPTTSVAASHTNTATASGSSAPVRASEASHRRDTTLEVPSSSVESRTQK
jgi:hypothetical protein